MQVHQPAIRPPTPQNPLRALIIQRCPQPEPPLQTIAGTDIIARKDIKPPVPSQQNVLGCPASDPTQFVQLRLNNVVVESGEFLQAGVPALRRGRNLDNGEALASTKTERPERFQTDACQIARPRKRLACSARSDGPRPKAAATLLSKLNPASRLSC
jgi:hypothetical protein